jgi:hypothetical protein
MHLRHAVTVGWFAATLPLAPMAAQEILSQTPSPDPAKWSFSLGVDPGQLDLHTPEPGIDARGVANLTRSWQTRNSRWARHISVMVGAEAPHYFHPFFFSLTGPPTAPTTFSEQCECWVRYASRYAALTAGWSYDLHRGSRFTPYLTGGTGLYYTAFRRSSADGVTPDEFPYYKQAFSQNTLSLGANLGLGLNMRFGSHQFFIEQMLHELDFNRQRGGIAIAPLNIGFRF